MSRIFSGIPLPLSVTEISTSLPTFFTCSSTHFSGDGCTASTALFSRFKSTCESSVGLQSIRSDFSTGATRNSTEYLGCTVTEAADGKQALDIRARDRFGAIVTDVRMPRVNGVKLVHQLHLSGRYIPIVIFVSGYLDLTPPDAFNLGVEAVISKPCEKKELIGAVKRSLLRRQLLFEPSVAVDPPAPDNYIREAYALGATASHVALGRGGVSLEVHHSIVANSSIGFSLSFAIEALTHLAGWGVLRWCEHSPDSSRVGIEFMRLDEENLRQFAQWLEELDPVSFIP